MRSRSVLMVILLICAAACPSFSQEKDGPVVEAVTITQQMEQLIGDRVRSSLGPQAAALDSAIRASVRLSPDYRIGAGDMLKIEVRGKVDLGFGNQSNAESTPKNIYEVTPDGSVHLPLLGPVDAAGKTTAELRKTITEGLSAFYKHFTVDLSVAAPGTIKVWVSGHVANPGPQALPSSATVLEALLRADIASTGSTRLIKLTRNGQTQLIDIYSVVAQGQLQANVRLEAGDEIHVPPAVNRVTVTGEVCRPGEFEIVKPHGSSGSVFCVSDLMCLCQGLLPSAAASNAVIERASSSGNLTAIHVDLLGGNDPEMLSGDKLVVPSLADYQPMIRLVGEFKGEGVYQRVAGTVLNKSGVYRFAKGETAGDVIARTGGTTPQADLKRAKIERRKGKKIEVIPLDLEGLIARQDESCDVTLECGDTIVLPALLDKVYVFGQVVRPGGYSYEPDRRLLEYLGYAGGLTGRAKSTMMIVRGDSNTSEVIRVKPFGKIGDQEKDNPIMQPGDVVFVPEGVVTDWRDVSQIISTIRLLTLF